MLLDVPKFRGEPYVTLDEPVMGNELADIAEAQGVSIEPGDALLEPLAKACSEEGRYEMLLCILPLRVQGCTGSPVNPIAVF